MLLEEASKKDIKVTNKSLEADIKPGAKFTSAKACRTWCIRSLTSGFKLLWSNAAQGAPWFCVDATKPTPAWMHEQTQLSVTDRICSGLGWVRKSCLFDLADVCTEQSLLV